MTRSARAIPRWQAVFLVLLTAGSCAHPASGRPSRPPAGGDPIARVARWNRERPGEPLTASVSFGTLLPDSSVHRLLERYGVRPYLAHAWAGGVADYAQVPPEAATYGVLAAARRKVLEHLERGVCGARRSVRVREREETALGTDRRRSDRAARAMLVRLAAQREAFPRVRAGAPIIWAIHVIGRSEDVARLARDPLVRGFEPADIGRDEQGAEWIGVPRPPEPPQAGRIEGEARIARLTEEQVRAELERIAADLPGECPDAR